MKGEKLMKEEDKLLKKIGTENPFRVPEGYFEGFTSDLMSRLPEKDVYGGHVYRSCSDYPSCFAGRDRIERAAATADRCRRVGYRNGVYQNGNREHHDGRLFAVCLFER